MKTAQQKQQTAQDMNKRLEAYKLELDGTVNTNPRKSMLLNHMTYITNNGGATIKDGAIVEYTQGYQVGTLDGKEITSAVLGELLIIADILELDTLGLWYSDASNLWYMDTSSVYIEDKAQAMQLGRDNKQLAIFEWSTKNDIKL